MTEGTDWELKDRRIAWMNCNTSASVIIAARITAGLYKPKDNKEAMKELLMAIDISYQAFLNISGNGGEKKIVASQTSRNRGPSAKEPLSPISPPNTTSFESGVVVDAPLPSLNGTGRQKKVDEGKWVCSECTEPVSTKVWEFSNDRFGRTLCFGCQDKERKRIEDATGPRDLMK